MIRLQANLEERCSLTVGESMALALSLFSRESRTNGWGTRSTGNHPVLSYHLQTEIDPEGWPMFR